MVTGVTGLRERVLHWRDQDNQLGRKPLASASVAERMTMFREGNEGMEPLWLWLNESGLPLRPASWENVFRAASQRCVDVLQCRMTEPPVFTPHMCRHSFALHMFVVLHYFVYRRIVLSA